MELRSSRRGFLRAAGLSAAAISIGPAVLPIRDLLEGATAQQVAPTAGELAAFAESIELAAVAFYGQLRPRVSRPPAVAAVTNFAKHHADHAAAIGPVAGNSRTGKPNRILSQTLSDQLGQAGSEDAALKVAYDLENSLASTYLFLVDPVNDTGDPKLAASILPVEAEHAVSLGLLIGQAVLDMTAPDKDQAGYETEARHLDPAAFPTVETTTTSTTVKK